MEKKYLILISIGILIIFVLGSCITPEDKPGPSIVYNWDSGESNSYKGVIPTANGDIQCILKDEDIELSLDKSGSFDLVYKTTSTDCTCEGKDTLTLETEMSGDYKSDDSSLTLTPDEVVITACGEEKTIEDPEKLEFEYTLTADKLFLALEDYVITFEK